MSEVRKCLFIVPASLKINWKKELVKWLVDDSLSIGIAEGKHFPDTNIVIINYDILSRHKETLDSIEWDILVCDEAHYLRNISAKRSKMVVGFTEWLLQSSVPREEKNSWEMVGDRWAKKVHYEHISAKKKVYLTGTPIVNRPRELWTLLSSLDPETWRSKSYFYKRYCGASSNEYGYDNSGFSNLEELQRKLRSTIMIRRLKKDVLKELPPKTRQIIEIPAVGALAKVVHKEAKDVQKSEERLVALRARVELFKASEDTEAYEKAVMELRSGVMVSFEELSALRRETAIAKAPYVINHIREILTEIEDYKIIVFGHHKELIDLLMAAFEESGYNPVKIDGRVTNKQKRQDAVDTFQNDPKCRVIVGSFGAMGVGHTLTASSHVVFAELDWVPGNISQSEDRAHRIGQEGNVLVQHLVVEGSIDATMAYTLVDKQNVIDNSLDENAELKSDPVLPINDASTTSKSRKQIERIAKELTEDQIEAIHQGLKDLSSMCDGAQQEDGMGFNKLDTVIGKSLAAQEGISAKQAALGMSLVTKYRRQLPDSLLDRVNPPKLQKAA